MFFSIYIYSKNANSIKNCVKFLSFKLNNLKFTKKNNKTNKTFITLLKSPHVNKTAQERFNADYFNKTLFIKAKNPILILAIFKILKKKLFFDVKFKITLLNNKWYGNRIVKRKTHPNNFNLFNNKIYLNNYVTILNNYGKSTVSTKFV